ncbi:MAG: hypothetical protein JST04_10410 [Bdellovibrionales bacterium]|nr:hypothetical protein [Bdellovibrionales bacterium]
MDQPKKDSAPTPAAKIFQILWVGLLGAQFMYAFILRGVLARGWESPDPRWLPNFGDPFEMSLGIAAAVTFLTGFVVPSLIARGMGAKIHAALRDESRPRDVVPPLLFAPFIVRLAMFEAVCLLGFVLANKAHAPNLIFPFLALSAGATLKNFPSTPEKVAEDLGLAGVGPR